MLEPESPLSLSALRTRREVIQRLGAAGALLSVPSLLAACGSGSDSSQGTVGGAGTNAPISKLTWAVSGPVPTLDIATGFSIWGAVMMSLGLERLLTVAPDFSLEPLLAESWSQPDPLHYVYRIRSGVTFWDGTELKPEDVAYSLARHADPKTASQLQSYFLNVKSFDVTGPMEVTVTMKQPDPLFQYIPTFVWVTPKAFSEKLGKQLGESGSKVNTMGTGPYRITSFDNATGMKAELRDDYWGKKPVVQKFDIPIIEDPQTLKLAMESGDIDGTFAVPAPETRSWRRLPGAAIEVAEPLYVAFLALDVTRPPFNDVHVRRAMAYAADREGFANAFLGGAGQPATCIVPPAQWGDMLPAEKVRELYASLPDYSFDLEKAKQELAQSKYPDGFSVSVQVNSTDVPYVKTCVAFSETLKQIGINLKVESTTSTKWHDDMLAHNQQVSTMAFYPDYPDPANYLTLIYPSANAVKNSYNVAKYKNPKVDALIKQQSDTTDKAERATAISEILRITGADAPYVPLYWTASVAAVDGNDYVLNDFTALFYNQNWEYGLQKKA